MKKAPGRPDLGRKKTLKDRKVDLYLPTVEMVKQWKDEAEGHGLSLSKFVVEVVDDALRKNPRGVTPREQLEDELNKTWAELTILSAEVEGLREAQKRSDATIAEYREKLAKPGAVSEESAEYVPLLAQLIQEEKVLPIETAKKLFGIGDKDVDALRAMGAAVDALASMGLVEKGISDWRWVGGVRRKKQATSHTRQHR
jgi:hypothetical protein